MIKQVKNPKYANKQHEAIILDVILDNEQEWCHYVARSSDCVADGVRLYYQAVLGEFGSIADSDEERILRGELPVPDGWTIQDGQLINLAAYAQAAEAELQRRLAELQTPEALAQAEIDEGYAAERKAKLAALLSVKKQNSWPLEVIWPDEG